MRAVEFRVLVSLHIASLSPSNQIDRLAALFHRRRPSAGPGSAPAACPAGTWWAGRPPAGSRCEYIGLPASQGAVRVGHHDVGRQRIAFRAQPVENPGAHARETGNDAAGEQLILRRGVDHHVAVAGADHGDIVDALGEMREAGRRLRCRSCRIA